MNKISLNYRCFKHHNCKCYSLYEYDGFIKQYIYQLKGCFDIELSHIFLNPILNEIKIMFSGYIVVPIPSNNIDNELRQFNHVIEIFKELNFPILEILYKDKQYKQSDQKKSDRKQIEKILKLSNLNSLKNKKILIVDDIFTTGSTLGAAIELVKQLNPKIIKCLVIAKVKH